MVSMAAQLASGAALGLAAFFAETRKARSFPAVSRTILIGATAILGTAVFGIFQMNELLAQGRTDLLGGLTHADWPIQVLHYAQIIPILLGAWVFGQDVALGPGRTAFLATPRRGALVAAKLLVVALLAGVAGILCTIAALAPLLSSGGTTTNTTMSLAPFGWLVAYWVLIALISASLVAATRSITLAVVPMLVWTVGLSALIVDRLPWLSVAVDQVFATAYFQGGAAPSPSTLAGVAAQVLVVLVIGAARYVRRDTH